MQRTPCSWMRSFTRKAMKTLNLTEAAEFLHCHAEWLREQAKLGRIPGAKPAKSWIFIEEDLVVYLRGHYAGRWRK